MGHRLLVVDSDRRFLQDHKASLESAFDVDFRDGTEGSLSHLESGDFAAVLLCVEASENKGYSLCSAIRRSPLLAELKVALISAKATEEEYARHQSLKGRADLYLHKPIRPSLLVSALTPLVPLKSVDPDNPLGDLGGTDLGDEWLESLKSELEVDTVPQMAPQPAPQAVPQPAPQPVPVSTVLGFSRPLLPLVPQALQKVPQIPRDAGRVELLEARVRDLETKLVANSDLLDHKQVELEELLRNGAATQNQFEETTLQVMELETRLETAEARAAAAEARLEAAEARAVTAEDRLEAAEARAAAAEARLDATEIRAVTAEDRLETADTRAATAEPRAATAEARLEAAEARAATAEARLEAAEARAATAETLLEAAESRAATAETRLEAAEARAAAAETELEQGGRNLEELTQQEQEARALLQDKSQLNMDLMESNQLLQAQLAEAREDAERLSRTQAALEDRTVELEAGRQEAEAALELLEAGAADLRGQIAAMEESHDRQQMELLAAIDDREARVGRLEESLNGLREQLQSLELEKEAARGQLQARSDRLQAVIGRLAELEGQARQAIAFAQSGTDE